MRPTAREEFDARLERELEKAVKKYGAEALVPTGHPEKDVHDYAINELVGLVRYADMIEARIRQFRDLGHVPRTLADDYLDTAEQIRTQAHYLGEKLIGHRRELRDRLGSLGDPEYREDR